MCDSKLSSTQDALLARISALENKVALLSKGVAIDSPSAVSTPAAAEPKAVRSTPKEAPGIEAREVKKEAPVTYLYNWNEVISKAGETDRATESFLKSCKCMTDGTTYRIVSAHKLMATMLDSPKNKKIIFDALVCCDIDIDSPEQIKISFENTKVEASDLDDFN